jgi:NAD(P)-dependent dehydrogenase (short-subunit alcohol dehydrogenase family)
MEITLKDKVSLVTGGGAGIGRAIAETFVGLGSKVVVAEIDAAKVADLNATLFAAGNTGFAMQADVRKAADAAEVVAETDGRYGRLDILVNNAGHHLGVFGTLQATTEEQIDALYNINLRHLFIVTKAATPLIVKGGRGGSIINLSSIEAFRGCPYNVAYTAFKHGVIGFTKALAVELSHEQIRVNGIAPETTDSEQVPLSVLIPPENKKVAGRPLPLGRYGRPMDHAGAAVYFAVDAMSSWVTGMTMVVDGGGLAASGFQRMPNGEWTIGPLVTGNVFSSGVTYSQP